MKSYQSHKVVEAAPVVCVDQDARIVTVSGDRAECHYQVPDNFFGRGAPAAGDYLVRYNDGYFSWSPKVAFEEGYTEVKSSALGSPAKPENLCFGAAVAWLKAGKRVARAGWNGKGMWLVLVPGTPKAQLREGTPYREALGLDECEILPHIDMWTTNAHGRRAMLPGWLASQSDMLAEDWHVVE